MNILEKIVSKKYSEIESDRTTHPINTLELMSCFNRETFSLKDALSNSNSSGVIAEYKRMSPSKGIINGNAPIENTTQGYVSAGADALSILTNNSFFGGSKEDLLLARQNNNCPILRKDFIIDEYQVVEAKAFGADAILLIAAILTADKIWNLAKLAVSFGMEVILEIRELKDLDGMNEYVDIVGVNNRNLKTFETDIRLSEQILQYLPKELVKISESGINTPQVAFELWEQGFDGFLIGEHFMNHRLPEQACASFISTFRKLVYAS